MMTPLNLHASDISKFTSLFATYVALITKVGLSYYLLCYHLIPKPGNKTGAPSWPDPCAHSTLRLMLLMTIISPRDVFYSIVIDTPMDSSYIEIVPSLNKYVLYVWHQLIVAIIDKNVFASFVVISIIQSSMISYSKRPINRSYSEACWGSEYRQSIPMMSSVKHNGGYCNRKYPLKSDRTQTLRNIRCQ